MDLTFLAQADQVTLKLELARASLENAKAGFEAAKLAYEHLLSQSDGHGIPKAKLKKLAEDRVQALIESGLVGDALRGEAKSATEAKRERPKKVKLVTEEEDEPVLGGEAQEKENNFSLPKAQPDELAAGLHS